MPVRIRKKVVRKSRKTIRKPSMKRSSLVSLIKKVSLKPVETKATHSISENNQLYHNVPFLYYGSLATSTGITEDNLGTSNVAMRLGDEVIARGLSFKFWFANKLDRPNVMYKIVIFKYQSNYVPTGSDPYFAQGTSNYMIRDLNTEKFKIVKVVRFNLENNAQRIPSGTTINGAEGHRAISVWIPLKNQKIKYQNNLTIPMFFDYGYTIVCYDSFGTLITDNIASFAVNKKFYFKDP